MSSPRTPRPSKASAEPAARTRGRTDDPALKLWVVLSRAYAAVARQAEADIVRHGLTPGEFGILEALYHRGPMLLGELHRKVLVTSGGITYLVDRLETKGFVERQECPGDRRARYAALTPAGTTLIERIFPDHAQCIARAVGSLPPAKQVQATALLRALGTSAAELPLPEER